MWQQGEVAELVRRTTSTGTLPSRKGYSNQKVHPGSNPGFSTKLVRVMSLIIIVVFYFVFVHGCMVRENSAP